MKIVLCIINVAWIFSIHSAKQETNQSFGMAEKENKRFRFTNSFIAPFPMQNSFLAQSSFKANNILTPNEQKKINILMHSIQFDQQGVSLFLHQTFNNKDYAIEFLPYSFTHITQFIDFAHASKQSAIFIEGVLRLFNQKLKSSPFVCAATLERFLDQNEQPLILHLSQKEFSLWKHFKKILSVGFKEKFSLIKEDPLGFFEYISKNLEQQVTITIMHPERIRMTFLRFLQQSLDKVMWASSDQEKTWYSLKKLGSYIFILHTQNVIPDDLDANDLYWSLIERYCYFLRLHGMQLTLETCTLIKDDLLKNEFPWLNQKEQESALSTKRERLTTALLETEAKIYASKQGIITDKLPYRNQKVA